MVEHIKDIFSDINSFRIILFLEEYNPDVTLEDIAESLKIERNDIIKILSKMIEADLVGVYKKRYKLTPFGMFTIQKMHELTGAA